MKAWSNRNNKNGEIAVYSYLNKPPIIYIEDDQYHLYEDHNY